MIEESFNELSPAQAERLAILAEECGEVVQMVGKTLRHGYNSVHPQDRTGPTNREMLSAEIGDLLGVIDLMQDDLDSKTIEHYREQKKLKVKRYTHHQP